MVFYCVSLSVSVQLLNACVKDAHACAELAALSNTSFMNTHRPGKISPMVYAAREGHAYAIRQMVVSHGNPENQGSDWVEFFAAATSTFTRDMAQALQLVLNLPFMKLPVRTRLATTMMQNPIHMR